MAHQPLVPLKLRAIRLGFAALRAISPDLAMRRAERLFSTPRRHALPDAERAISRSGCAFHVNAEGLRIHAHTWGEGPRVVLIHGWEGRGTQLHAFIEPLVAAGFSVTAMDAPGHGRSRGRTSGPLHFAKALQALVRKIGPIHGIVAHSLGSAATGFAIERGLPVSRAVFISPPAAQQRFYTDCLSLLGFPASLHDRAIKAFSHRVGFTWDSMSLKQLAPRMRKPLLLIHDRLDRETPWDESASIAETWPRAELLITEGLGHRRILKDAAVVERTVAFLNQGVVHELDTFQGHTQRGLEHHLFRRDLRTA